MGGRSIGAASFLLTVFISAIATRIISELLAREAPVKAAPSIEPSIQDASAVVNLSQYRAYRQKEVFRRVPLKR